MATDGPGGVRGKGTGVPPPLPPVEEQAPGDEAEAASRREPSAADGADEFLRSSGDALSSPHLAPRGRDYTPLPVPQPPATPTLPRPSGLGQGSGLFARTGPPVAASRSLTPSSTRVLPRMEPFDPVRHGPSAVEGRRRQPTMRPTVAAVPPPGMPLPPAPPPVASPGMTVPPASDSAPPADISPPPISPPRPTPAEELVTGGMRVLFSELLPGEGLYKVRIQGGKNFDPEALKTLLGMVIDRDIPDWKKISHAAIYVDFPAEVAAPMDDRDIFYGLLDILSKRGFKGLFVLRLVVGFRTRFHTSIHVSLHPDVLEVLPEVEITLEGALKTNTIQTPDDLDRISELVNELHEYEQGVSEQAAWEMAGIVARLLRYVTQNPGWGEDLESKLKKFLFIFRDALAEHGYLFALRLEDELKSDPPSDEARLAFIRGVLKPVVQEVRLAPYYLSVLYRLFVGGVFLLKKQGGSEVFHREIREVSQAILDQLAANPRWSLNPSPYSPSDTELSLYRLVISEWLPEFIEDRTSVVIHFVDDPLAKGGLAFSQALGASSEIPVTLVSSHPHRKLYFVSGRGQSALFDSDGSLISFKLGGRVYPSGARQRLDIAAMERFFLGLNRPELKPFMRLGPFTLRSVHVADPWLFAEHPTPVFSAVGDPIDFQTLLSATGNRSSSIMVSINNISLEGPLTAQDRLRIKGMGGALSEGGVLILASIHQDRGDYSIVHAYRHEGDRLILMDDITLPRGFTLGVNLEGRHVISLSGDDLPRKDEVEEGTPGEGAMSQEGLRDAARSIPEMEPSSLKELNTRLTLHQQWPSFLVTLERFVSQKRVLDRFQSLMQQLRSWVVEQGDVFSSSGEPKTQWDRLFEALKGFLKPLVGADSEEEAFGEFQAPDPYQAVYRQAWGLGRRASGGIESVTVPEGLSEFEVFMKEELEEAYSHGVERESIRVAAEVEDLKHRYLDWQKGPDNWRSTNTALDNWESILLFMAREGRFTLSRENHLLTASVGSRKVAATHLTGLAWMLGESVGLESQLVYVGEGAEWHLVIVFDHPEDPKRSILLDPAAFFDGHPDSIVSVVDRVAVTVSAGERWLAHCLYDLSKRTILTEDHLSERLMSQARVVDKGVVEGRLKAETVPAGMGSDMDSALNALGALDDAPRVATVAAETTAAQVIEAVAAAAPDQASVGFRVPILSRDFKTPQELKGLLDEAKYTDWELTSAEEARVLGRLVGRVVDKVREHPSYGREYEIQLLLARKVLRRALIDHGGVFASEFVVAIGTVQLPPKIQQWVVSLLFERIVNPRIPDMRQTFPFLLPVFECLAESQKFKDASDKLANAQRMALEILFSGEQGELKGGTAVDLTWPFLEPLIGGMLGEREGLRIHVLQDPSGGKGSRLLDRLSDGQRDRVRLVSSFRMREVVLVNGDGVAAVFGGRGDEILLVKEGETVTSLMAEESLAIERLRRAFSETGVRHSFPHPSLTSYSTDRLSHDAFVPNSLETVVAYYHRNPTDIIFAWDLWPVETDLKTRIDTISWLGTALPEGGVIVVGGSFPQAAAGSYRGVIDAYRRVGQELRLVEGLNRPADLTVDVGFTGLKRIPLHDVSGIPAPEEEPAELDPFAVLRTDHGPKVDRAFVERVARTCPEMEGERLALAVLAIDKAGMIAELMIAFEQIHYTGRQIVDWGVMDQLSQMKRRLRDWLSGRQRDSAVADAESPAELWESLFSVVSATERITFSTQAAGLNALLVQGLGSRLDVNALYALLGRDRGLSVELADVGQGNIWHPVLVFPHHSHPGKVVLLDLACGKWDKAYRVEARERVKTAPLGPSWFADGLFRLGFKYLQDGRSADDTRYLFRLAACLDPEALQKRLRYIAEQRALQRDRLREAAAQQGGPAASPPLAGRLTQAIRVDGLRGDPPSAREGEEPIDADELRKPPGFLPYDYREQPYKLHRVGSIERRPWWKREAQFLVPTVPVGTRLGTLSVNRDMPQSGDVTVPILQKAGGQAQSMGTSSSSDVAENETEVSKSGRSRRRTRVGRWKHWAGVRAAMRRGVMRRVLTK